MERIQSAIARAREERARRLGDGTLAPPAARAADTAAPAPAETQPAVADAGGPAPSPAVDAAVDAAWAALATMRVDPPRLVRARVTSHEAGPAAAPHDMLRTRILQQCRANNWRRIGITSPGPGCGKSTLALNLGFSFARQRDTRAILVEADLRRPSLVRMLGLRGAGGAVRVLEGVEPFARHALRHGTNLAFLLVEGPARNPAELLHGPNAGAVLRGVEVAYAPAVMLFDLPPLFAADDVLAFAPQLDAVLIVAAAEQTTVDEVDAAERDLAPHVSVMGVVLNKCRYAERSYGYAYGY